MSQNMLRVAESFWQEGLKSDPSHEGLRARLITLAGIRLDPQSMLHQLLEVPKDVALNEQQVLLCLSGFAIDTHGVLPVEEQLRWSLEADSEDMKTRVGLARALMILGRHSECLSLLEDSQEDAAAVTLRALVRLNRHELVADCVELSVSRVSEFHWLPKSCAYRTIAEGRDLSWWHPLVSGDPETVFTAGIAVRGKVIAEAEILPEQEQDMIVQLFK